MQSEMDIRRSLVNYILLNDSSYTETKLTAFSLLELIVIKTEIELQEIRPKSIP